MKRLLGVALFLLAAAVAQAQTAPPPTEPTHPTAYNAFYNILALPTSGPIIEAPAGSSICAVVLNQPSTNTTITPQGSDDTYVWHALSNIGRGSITMPGLYIGTNPYRFFRPYFGSFASPGISGYEACGDNQTSVIAPMLNGENGVLNTYQELIAVGHPGCAVFDANGFLIPQGGGLPCAGGGGSTCANPPSPAPSPSPLGCVVLQDSPSPTPQLYNDGQGSAAVGGILQGGSLYTEDGSLNSQSSVMTFCADETNGFCNQQGFAGFALTNDVEGMDLQQRGFSASFGEAGNTSNFSVSAGGTGFGSSGGGDILFDAFASTNTVGSQFEMSTLTGTSKAFLGATNVDIEGTKSSLATPAPGSIVRIGNVTPEVDLGCCGSPTGSAVLIGGTSGNGPTHIEFNGTLESQSSGGGPTFGNAPWGTCSMTGTTCTTSIHGTYTQPICLATVQGGTAIAGACSVTGGTITITAATSNSDTWAFIILGAPN